MEKHSIIICILLAIITTNLIRVVPMLLIKGQISNRFLRSFLYYAPSRPCQASSPWSSASSQPGAVWDFSPSPPSAAPSSI